MKKINLEEYTKSKKLLLVFDVVIKSEVFNKDAFLEERKIAPSSYRRARAKEQKVGEEIVLKLSTYFGLKLVDDEFIKNLEKLIDSLYFDINYRVIENHEKYIKEIDEMLLENTILFPILNLIKLFAITFYDKDVLDTVAENIEDFEYVSQFTAFFNDDLMEIYDLLRLSYSKTFTKEMLAKQYKNGISYSIIAAKHCLDKKYYDSLFFALKAKNIFINENNLRRILCINFTILNNLASTWNFEEYYNLAYVQMQIIKSFRIETSEKNVCNKHITISALSMGRYDDVCSMVEINKNITLTEVFCYVIAKFNTKKLKDFKIWYDDFLVKRKIPTQVKEKCDILIDYLILPEKRKIIEIEQCSIMPALIEVLKWS